MNERYFTSFLDIIACGLGAAILLFLIGVQIQEDLRSSESEETVLVRCEHVGGSPAVIGIEYQINNKPWTLASTLDTQEGYALGTASKNDERMISLLVLFRPKTGIWKFRPVLLNFAGGTAEEVTMIRLSVSGPQISDQTVPKTSLLKRVGEKGKIHSVKITPHK